MFTALSLLALATTNVDAGSSVALKKEFNQIPKKAAKKVNKQLKAQLVKHASTKARSLMASSDFVNSTESHHRQLRFSSHFKSTGFFSMEAHNDNVCSDKWVEMSFPIKKNIGCEANSDGTSLFFHDCFTDGSGDLNFNFTVHDHPTCGGPAIADTFSSFGIQTSVCSDVFGMNVKYSCHAGVGNALFGKSGFMFK